MTNTTNNFRFLGDRELFAFINDEGHFYFLGLFHAFGEINSDTYVIIRDFYDRFPDKQDFTENEVVTIIQDLLKEYDCPTDIEKLNLSDERLYTAETLIWLTHCIGSGLNKLKGLHPKFDHYLEEHIQRFESFFNSQHLLYEEEAFGAVSVADLLITIQKEDDHRFSLQFFMYYGQIDSYLMTEGVDDPYYFQDYSNRDIFYENFGFYKLATASFTYESENDIPSIDWLKDHLRPVAEFEDYCIDDFYDLHKRLKEYLKDNSQENSASEFLGKDIALNAYFWEELAL